MRQVANGYIGRWQEQTSGRTRPPKPDDPPPSVEKMTCYVLYMMNNLERQTQAMAI